MRRHFQDKGDKLLLRDNTNLRVAMSLLKRTLVKSRVLTRNILSSIQIWLPFFSFLFCLFFFLSFLFYFTSFVIYTSIHEPLVEGNSKRVINDSRWEKSNAKFCLHNYIPLQASTKVERNRRNSGEAVDALVQYMIESSLSLLYTWLFLNYDIAIDW